MKDFMKMMKQAQEIQGRMAQMQSEVEALELTGTAGAGLVSVTVNGKGAMKGVSIDPSLLKPEEAEILEDLIIAAFGDAKAKSEAAMQEKMKELTGGLSLPPDLNLF